jgi:hypothetical protein
LSSERKLDIFKLLAASDKNDGEWFSKQPQDAQKEFAAPVVLRWGATVNDGLASVFTLLLVNERVNVHLYDLYKHPELTYRLLASCGTGESQRHQWIPPHKKKGASNKAYDLLAKHNLDANSGELELLMSLHTKESFSKFVDECGIPTAEAKEIIKAYVKYRE